MPNVSFSLAERVVIDPILTLRAPLPPLENGKTASWTATVWQFAQSELIARVAAVFVSVFAAADCLTHLLNAVYDKLFSARSYASEHLSQATWFAKLMLIGSVAGVIWPDLLKRCRYSPPEIAEAPAHIHALASAVVDNQIIAPFNPLKQFWKQGSLEDKHWFVQVFSAQKRGFGCVRLDLVTTIYRPFPPLQSQQVNWHGSALGGNDAFFYHATSEQALASILKTGRVEVRHEKAFRGAFVSTKPEKDFGCCILGFRKIIERLSPLEHGFQADENSYWAGFSRDIPVTVSTLAYVILVNGRNNKHGDLVKNCKSWAGRRIAVLDDWEAERRLACQRSLNMGIPSEWPLDDPMKPEILATLRIRATNVVQMEPQRLKRLQQQLATAH